MNNRKYSVSKNKNKINLISTHQKNSNRRAKGRGAKKGQAAADRENKRSCSGQKRHYGRPTQANCTCVSSSTHQFDHQQ